MQVKKPYRKLQEELNEGEIGNLHEKEFRVKIVKMTQDLRKRIEAWIKKTQKKFFKNLKVPKNKQMNKTITEVKKIH